MVPPRMEDHLGYMSFFDVDNPSTITKDAIAQEYESIVPWRSASMMRIVFPNGAASNGGPYRLYGFLRYCRPEHNHEGAIAQECGIIVRWSSSMMRLAVPKGAASKGTISAIRVSSALAARI